MKKMQAKQKQDNFSFNFKMPKPKILFRGKHSRIKWREKRKRVEFLLKFVVLKRKIERQGILRQVLLDRQASTQQARVKRRGKRSKQASRPRPLPKIDKMFKSPMEFKRRTRFVPAVWHREIFFKIKDKIKVKRAHMVTKRNRVLRWSLYMRGVKCSDLSFEFKDSLSRTYFDVKLISAIFARELADKWIHMPEPGSEEYRKLLALFPRYNNVPYAGDVSKIFCRRPTRAESDFYCGHKRRHCLSILCFVDGIGCIRRVLGPVPGVIEDTIMIKKSAIYNNFDKVLAPGDKILYDGALSGAEWKPHFIAPHSTRRIGRINYNSLTEEQKQEDRVQRQSRIVVEHTFSRVKTLFNVTNPLQCNLKNAWHILYSAFILTNIHTTYESPIRKS